MSLLRLIARRHAWLAALLLVLSMGARAATPQGYMPEARAKGSLALVPCNGFIPAAAPMEHMHHHGGMHVGEDGHRGHHADQPCVFAGLVGPLLPHAALPEVFAPFASPQDFAIAARAPRAVAHRIVRPPSRGPPVER